MTRIPMPPAARQMALPLSQSGAAGPIVIGNANRAVIAALEAPARWPFHAALLVGPPRAGKSRLARWFAEAGLGIALDDAPSLDETELFHRWNAAQNAHTPLLLTAPAGGWTVTLPDLASRLGAMLTLEITAPDDAMLAELLLAHAQARGLMLGEGVARYLAARVERSYRAAERLIAIIDRLTLERHLAPGPAICRVALEELGRDGLAGGDRAGGDHMDGDQALDSFPTLA